MSEKQTIRTGNLLSHTRSQSSYQTPWARKLPFLIDQQTLELVITKEPDSRFQRIARY